MRSFRHFIKYVKYVLTVSEHLKIIKNILTKHTASELQLWIIYVYLSTRPTYLPHMR